MKYEIELSTRQQIEELNEIVETINRGLRGLPRKRSLSDSERVMTAVKYKRAAIAVQMAIDRLSKTP
jgi:hypothetical protein